MLQTNMRSGDEPLVEQVTSPAKKLRESASLAAAQGDSKNGPPPPAVKQGEWPITPQITDVNVPQKSYGGDT
jgi:hypothetical protein